MPVYYVSRSNYLWHVENIADVDDTTRDWCYYIDFKIVIDTTQPASAGKVQMMRIRHLLSVLVGDAMHTCLDTRMVSGYRRQHAMNKNRERENIMPRGEGVV